MTDRCIENVIEWLVGDKRIAVTASEQKLKTKLKKLYDRKPEEFKDWTINEDGSIFCTIPRNWIYLSIPREVSEEERARLATIGKGSLFTSKKQ